jgi:hypothetical protein
VEGPGHWPHASHRLRDKALGALRTLGVDWASHRARLEGHRALDAPTLGPPPTYLRIRRPEGEGCRRQPVIGVAAASDPPFTLKASIDKLRRRSPDRPAVRALRLVKTAAPPEPRNELPPFHSITSSARASSVGGTSIPSAFAVLRLIANSNLVGCCTGKSPGFSPLSIRPT